ncbi:C25 family cysteine peptidase [Candidatus Zixiibacteriota bacterium]
MLRPLLQVVIISAFVYGSSAYGRHTLHGENPAPTANVGDGRIIQKYSFAPPQITEVVIAGERLARLAMPDAPCGGAIGRPALPARAAHILLPPGTAAAKIRILADGKIPLGEAYLVEPVECPAPLSAVSPTVPGPPIRDHAVYTSIKPYPATRYREIGTYDFRGYRILILRLQPVEYTPKTGALAYYPELTVIVETREVAKPHGLFRGRAADEREAATRVDNPAAVADYPRLARTAAEDYELLIIAHPPWLAASFQPLKDYHDTTGIMTEIRTTAEVGGTTPDDLRDYIRDEYLNHGIEYVLVAADDHQLPAQDLYVKSWEGIIHGDPPIYSYDMPADVYFGCLDGTYNFDGDALWGEPTDGEDGGDVDLLAEVYVGRAPVDDIADADRFVTKTLAYLTAAGPYLEKVIIAAELLGYGGPVQYAAPYMDEIIDGSSNHGYTTVGVPSDQYTIELLYDRDWPNWPAAEMISRINAGRHIINHLGHCIDYYALKMYETDVAQLTNDDYCFIYTQGCYAGAFDSLGCMAEYFTVDYDHGAFAGIMNARYGYGSSRTTEQTTDSPAQRFDREFCDAVFNPAETRVGLRPTPTH